MGQTTEDLKAQISEQRDTLGQRSRGDRRPRQSFAHGAATQGGGPRTLELDEGPRHGHHR